MRGITSGRRPLALAGALLVSVLVASGLVASGLVASGLTGVGTAVSAAAQPAAATACDPLDPVKCLFPFPNDSFTVRDRSTDTGRRVAFSADAMPRNAAGVAIDPTEWNRNDGFSPGSPILTFVPGLDIAQTGLVTSTNIGGSLSDDAPIVLLDAVTRERVPYWVELDASVSSDELRTLIVRPAVNFEEGHRILVAMRGMKDADGHLVPPSETFLAYRDGTELTGDAEARRPHMERVFKGLERHGIERDELYLAWDFTVASERNLSERLLHIRDDAFADLGRTAPEFTVTQVEEDVGDDRVARFVHGTFRVPSYLTGAGGPGERFLTGDDGLPRRNGELEASFMCTIPRAVLRPDGRVQAAIPVVYGHGLLGSRDEVDAGNVRDMANEHGYVYCATDWIGMSEEDIPNAISILQDLGRFPTLADRVQQGILDTLFLARLLVHDDGLRSHPAFRNDDGKPVLKGDEAVFDGNSQGGIIGGAATAVAQDWKQAVLGVPGMNYSTLLQRSIDFDTYEAVLDPAYPDEIDRTLAITLIQMLWDRAEANGYAHHMTDDPYPRTPPHRVLLHPAFGDHQVANVTTDVEARTIGARAHLPALQSGRTDQVEPLWGIRGIDDYPYAGSAIFLWDSGAPTPPVENLAPRDGEDPHQDPRSSPSARRQKASFLRPNGKVVDVCDDAPCTAAPAG